MAKGTRKLEPWEASLIRAMLGEGRLNRDQILTYFSRPDRTVNAARINEIASGKLFADIEPATAGQVSTFVDSFRSPGEAQHRFFEENPLHPVNLQSLFRLKSGTSDVLHIDETDRVECKESINFASKAEYARVIASFANARGGFLLFGVRDADKVVKGIPAGRLSGYDSARLNQFLSEHLSPAPVWEKIEIEIGGKTVGVLYVRPAIQKPIICTRDNGSDLKEAEIYYRYPGETRRIKYAELVQILDERARRREEQWVGVLGEVERAGVENAAILNTRTGEVIGQSGRFVIDEALIPKLKFVTEGHFTETAGAPALRLVGDVSPIAGTKDGGPVTKVHLSDDDLMEDFVNRHTVTDPAMYIKHMAHSHKLWLPIFYYIRQANLSEREAATLIRGEKGTKSKHVQDLVKRIEKRSIQAGVPNAMSVDTERKGILARSIPIPPDETKCGALLKAIRTLKPGEIDPESLFPLLKNCFDRFRGGKLALAIQYALAHVDTVWHVQLIADVKRAAKQNGKK